MKKMLHLGACAAWALATASAACAAPLVSENYETSTPNMLPNASGFLLSWYGDFNSPAGYLWRTAQDGAIFDDPMGPAGNKSAVLDNNGHGFTQAFPSNDGPTNATMGYNWTPDPTTFTAGHIQYDFYLSPAPEGGITYVDHRFGYRTDRLNFVSTGAADTVGWYSLRATADAGTIAVNGLPGVGAASVQPLVGAVNTLRVDFTPGFMTYTLNGSLVEWTTPVGPRSLLPWFSGATGVSGMTWVGDFQATPGAPHGLIFIDNVRVVPIPEPAAGLLLCVAGAAAAIRRRR